MMIEKITPFLVDRCLVVRVYTDSAMVGTGEAGLWAHHKLVYEAITQLSDYYDVGKDASQIEHHFQVLSRDTHFQRAVLSAALSAIDIALWDILGKSLGQPIYQLLGGKVRAKIRVFANVVGSTPEEIAESARKSLNHGYTSLRVIPFFARFEPLPSTQIVSQSLAIVHAIREEIGFDVDLRVEIHRNMTKPEVVQFGNAVAPYRLLYMEDPLAPESTDSLRYVADHVNVRSRQANARTTSISSRRSSTPARLHWPRPLIGRRPYTGQRNRRGSRGGLYRRFSHLMGGPVNMAAYVQFDAAIPNYVLQESHKTADFLKDILDQPLQRDGGFVIVPNWPRIGVELREDKLSAFPYRPYTPSGWFGEDGSVAH